VNEGTVAVAVIDDGNWSACFGLSYRDLLLHDIVADGRIVPRGKEMRQLSSRTSIASSRNKMAAGMLDTTQCEWLWFIDVDMGFGPDTVEQLIKAADPELRPVMGGLCFAMKRARTADFWAERVRIQPTVYEYLELEDEVGFRPIREYARDQVQQVAATGAACLLIHRSALEKVRAHYGDNWFTQATHPTGDKGKPRVFSEDLSFCVRLAALDIPVHVNTAVKTTHDKGGIFLDEETFDAQTAS
jgi:hypothetical protein